MHLIHPKLLLLPTSSLGLLLTAEKILLGPTTKDWTAYYMQTYSPKPQHLGIFLEQTGNWSKGEKLGGTMPGACWRSCVWAGIWIQARSNILRNTILCKYSSPMHCNAWLSCLSSSVHSRQCLIYDDSLTWAGTVYCVNGKIRPNQIQVNGS